MTVSCSKGTYIRTLCHDIGQALGCGGCMESLVRTRVGDFHLEQAITLKELEAKRDAGELDSCLVTVEQIFSGLPAVTTRKPYDVLIHNGNRVLGNMLETVPQEKQVRMYDSSGLFTGIYEWDPVKKDYKPLKMFL